MDGIRHDGTEDPLDRTFRWFLLNRDSLIKGHEGEFVLLKDCRAVGYYKTEDSALVDALSHGLKYGDFLVQNCNRKLNVLISSTAVNAGL